MADFGVNYATVRAAADRLVSENTKLNGIVDRMESTARARFAGWAAQSEGTYTAVAGKWSNQATEMGNDLNASIQKLLRKVDAYEEADRRASQI